MWSSEQGGIVIIKLFRCNDEWAVEFPIAEGCFGGGKTAIEAIGDGLDNLKSYAETLGLPLPDGL